MEGDEERSEGHVFHTFRKSFVQVQNILDQNKMLIEEINHNQETKQAHNLSRNVGLIRELNSNFRRVVDLYADLSGNFRSGDASSDGGSPGFRPSGHKRGRPV